MEDKEILIRQSVLLEKIGEKVNMIEASVNAMKDGHIMKTESRCAVMEEKIGRMEKIIYTLGALLAGTIISSVTLWIQKN